MRGWHSIQPGNRVNYECLQVENRIKSILIVFLCHDSLRCPSITTFAVQIINFLPTSGNKNANIIYNGPRTGIRLRGVRGFIGFSVAGLRLGFINSFFARKNTTPTSINKLQYFLDKVKLYIFQ